MEQMRAILDNWQAYRDLFVDSLIEWFTSPAFYGQIGVIAVAVIAAVFAARWIRKRIGRLPAQANEAQGLRGRLFAAAAGAESLLLPFLLVLLLAAGVSAAQAALGSAWLIRLAQGASVIWLLYAAINRYITHPLARTAAIWLGIPVATLKVFGWYDAVAAWLDGLAISVGNIHLSAYFLLKAAVFGGLFFWLGGLSSRSGKQAIRRQESLDRPTRELFAKLFELALYFAVFILLMQVLGLNLTTLAVFGGAIGVGLGFGLQQIASNFISGLIILLERSITVGDYIELEDGRAGIVKQINMRSSTLETFDGKEIIVPNEKFITTRFVNWTHDDPRQRYEVSFTVAYDTDLHAIPPIIEAAVSRHPRVLQEPEEPDCELRGFGDRGVEFAVEFWVDGLDDGPNKFSSDVLFLVWDALRENGVRIPYPRQEIALVEEGRPPASAAPAGKGKGAQAKRKN